MINEDCLLNIFDYLSVEDEIACSKVCTEWFAVIRRKWRKCSLNLWINPTLRSTISDYKRIDADAIDIVKLCGYTLKKVTIADLIIPKSSGKYNVEIIHSCLEIRNTKLRVYMRNANDILKIVVDVCTQLNYFALSINVNADVIKLLAELFMKNQKLETVILSDMRGISETLNYIPRSVKHLVLNEVYVQATKFLDLLVNLKTFVFSDTSKTISEAITRLKADKLKTLKLKLIINKKLTDTLSCADDQTDECEVKDTDEQIIHITNTLQSITRFTNLEELLLFKFWCMLSYSALDSITDNCKNLRAVAIKYSNISNSSAQLLTSKLPCLESLDLSTTKVNDLLASENPLNLKIVKLRLGINLSTFSLFKLLYFSQNLQCVELSFFYIKPIVMKHFIMEAVTRRKNFLFEAASMNCKYCLSVTSEDQNVSECIVLRHTPYIIIKYYSQIESFVKENCPFYRVAQASTTFKKDIDYDIPAMICCRF